MSEHKAVIEWARNEVPFEYKEYPRNHVWKFENGVEIEGSAAAGYLGDAGKTDPEEAFVASLSSCHMLTFLALASKKKWILDRYVDRAVGFVGKNEAGAMAITKVELHPETTFADGIDVSADALEALHEAAHKYCFIANSVKCEVVTVL